MTIRNRRRNRHRQAQALREADARATELISLNPWLAWATWGGSRCPSCGTQIRPYQLIKDGGRVGMPCHSGPCNEDLDGWMDRAVARMDRVHRYRLRTGVDDGWR